MRKIAASFIVFLAACSTSETPSPSEDSLDFAASDVAEVSPYLSPDSSDDTSEEPAPDVIGEVQDSASDTDAGSTELEAGRPPRGNPVEVLVGSPPDDALLFMNPDTLEGLLSCHAVRTLMMAAGDACGALDPALRELGLRAAYGLMTLGPDSGESDWSCQDCSLGMPAHICWLDSPTPVSLALLRALDCAPALLNLLEGEMNSLASVATPSSVIFPDDLTIALAQDLAEIDVVRVHTLEPTGAYGYDNDDHIAAARIALEAAAGAGVTECREHRTNNTDEDPLHVQPDDLDTKWDALVAYCGPAGEEEGLCERDSGWRSGSGLVANIRINTWRSSKGDFSQAKPASLRQRTGRRWGPVAQRIPGSLMDFNYETQWAVSPWEVTQWSLEAVIPSCIS